MKHFHCQEAIIVKFSLAIFLDYKNILLTFDL